MAVATYQDVAVAIARPISTEAEQAQVTYWLNGVELYIKARFGDLSILDQDALTYVETEAVAAKVNRHGTRESSITVSVDDANVTRRYENPVTAGDISDEWWDLLEPTAAADAFTVSPYATRQRLTRACSHGDWPSA